ncbi:MAG TPA: hypothetical protein VM677_24230 [Actinokineospora sp.]|nr:hypothetical protein [Actinokineospora sp.]
MRRRLAAAVGFGAVCVVGAGALLLAEPGAAASSEPDCVFLRVHNLGDTGLSVLTRVRLSDGVIDRVGALGYRIDAIGHVPGAGVSYGLATRGLTGLFPDGAHVVAFDAAGTVRDLGAVRGELPWDGLADAKAGAVVGGALVVRDYRYLYSIDIDPRRPSYLSVVRTVELRPAELARTVDDYGVRDGMLYGVTTHATVHGQVVKIDPATGEVSQVPTPRLPGGRAYGAALIGPDGALYAAGNQTWGRSRLYRVELREDAQVRAVAVWPAVDSADATGCLSAPAQESPVSGSGSASQTRPPGQPGSGSASQTVPPNVPGGGSATQTPPTNPTGGGSVTQTKPGTSGGGSDTQTPAPNSSGSGLVTQTVPPNPPGSGSATQIPPPPPPPMSGWATRVPPPPLSGSGRLTVAVPALPPLPAVTGEVSIAIPAPRPGASGSASAVRPPPPPVRLSPTPSPTKPAPPSVEPSASIPAEVPKAPPSARKRYHVAPEVVPEAVDRQAATDKKRRWGVTVLVLVLGAGAGAGMKARRRR